MRVHFFQPAQFNRTADKTNPFFDPIIRVCERERIPYRVFCAERYRSGSGYGAKWGNSWILFLAEVLALRCVKWFKVSPQRSYRVWGWMANLLTFGHYRADVCITVAGMHLEILQGVAPKARLVDLQHGVIYSTHSGYFDKAGVLLPKLAENRQREYWLYGEGFWRVFLRRPENWALLEGRVHVVGDVVRAGRCRQHPSKPKTKILLAFQFTPDFPSPMLQQMKRLWEDFLDANRTVIEAEHLTVLIRHHPRFADVIDMSDWGSRYPWLSVDARPMEEVLAETRCCVTINSTVVFDAAAEGVTTVLLDGTPLGWSNIFRDEYTYPFAETDLGTMMTLLRESPTIVSERLALWYNDYYTKFDEGRLLKLLLGAERKD